MFGLLTYQPRDRPTNMSKAIYSHFVEGAHNYENLTKKFLSTIIKLKSLNFLPDNKILDLTILLKACEDYKM